MKLFIPGPTQVAPEILAEMSHPAIGHRTEECARLWKECRDGLRQLMATEGEILMITGPASAMMEAAIRNTVAERMTTDVITGSLTDEVETIMGLMTKNRIRHMPILENGELAGMISIGDVVKAQHAELSMENHYLKEYIQS